MMRERRSSLVLVGAGILLLGACTTGEVGGGADENHSERETSTAGDPDSGQPPPGDPDSGQPPPADGDAQEGDPPSEPWQPEDYEIGLEAPSFADLCPPSQSAAVHLVSAGESLQAAINQAAAGDVVKVAAGTYEESVEVANKSVCLAGGFSAVDNFASFNPGENPSILVGSQEQAVVSISSAGGAVVAGFTIQNGRHGFDIRSGAESTGATVALNTIENNGVRVTSRDERGGGLLIAGRGHRIINNIIRNNVSGMGAGVFSSGEDILLAGNLIEGNEAYSDHGGATFLTGSVRVEHNVVQHNLVSASLNWGSGAGIFINGPQTVGYVAFNIVRFNHANAYGGGVDSDGGATIYMNNTLVYGNTSDGRAPGVYISQGDPQPGTLFMTHCTVFNNTAVDLNCGMGLDARGGAAQVSNSIFWGDGGNSFFVDPGFAPSAIVMDYSIAEQEWPGTGNSTADPLFVDSEQGDFHLRSTAGRWDPAANSGEGGWTVDTQHSPGIDAGDPAADFSLEPPANGSRVNMGMYGGTQEASRSLSQ